MGHKLQRLETGHRIKGAIAEWETAGVIPDQAHLVAVGRQLAPGLAQHAPRKVQPHDLAPEPLVEQGQWQPSGAGGDVEDQRLLHPRQLPQQRGSHEPAFVLGHELLDGVVAAGDQVVRPGHDARAKVGALGDDKLPVGQS